MTSSIEKAMAQQNKAAQEKNSPIAQKVLSTNTNENGLIQGRNPADIDTPVCKLDFSELSKQGLLTPDTSNKKFIDEYRAIKRLILSNAFDKGASNVENSNLVMVISALPAEGKTFTSFNLAMSIAMERDTTVLLVDSDIIKRSMTHMLGLEDRPGLTDVLLDHNLSLGDVMVKSSMPKLNVVPSGRTHMHSTELLASQDMGRVAMELSRRYPDRIVLFDAPPILVTTEAQVLTRLAGQVMVVVEAGKTEQSLVQEAVGLLDNNKVVGMILNKSRSSMGGGYYGSGYGHYGS
jgi:exopolysaccharide/PEP-CTERM locus tyrosine autokinase